MLVSVVGKLTDILDCVRRDILSIATKSVVCGAAVGYNGEGWASLTVFAQTVLQAALNVC